MNVVNKYSKQLLSVELSTFHTNPSCLYALDEIALVGRNGSGATCQDQRVGVAGCRLQEKKSRRVKYEMIKGSKMSRVRFIQSSSPWQDETFP